MLEVAAGVEYRGKKETLTCGGRVSCLNVNNYLWIIGSGLPSGSLIT